METWAKRNQCLETIPCNKKINQYLRETFKHSPLAQYIANIPAEETLEDYTTQ